MDDGDILCHPILVPSYPQEFDIADAKIEAKRNPQRTEVIYFVDDLDAAPRVETWRCAEHGQSLHSYRWKRNTRSRCWITTVRSGPDLCQGRWNLPS